MNDTTPGHIVDYVRAAARFARLALDEAAVERVAMHLARTEAMVDSLRLVPLPHDAEPAEIFRPAPFPTHDPEQDAR